MTTKTTSTTTTKQQSKGDASLFARTCFTCYSRGLVVRGKFKALNNPIEENGYYSSPQRKKGQSEPESFKMHPCSEMGRWIGQIGSSLVGSLQFCSWEPAGKGDNHGARRKTFRRSIHRTKLGHGHRIVVDRTSHQNVGRRKKRLQLLRQQRNTWKDDRSLHSSRLGGNYTRRMRQN